MIVRSARPDDEPQLWDMFHSLHKENALLPMDEGKVQFFLDRALHPDRIKSDDQGIRGTIGVIDGSGKLQGCIMLVLAQQWYTSHWHLEEFLNYVRPEHRKSNNAKELIKFAKSCATRLDVPLIIGIVSNTRTEAKVRLYERQLPKAGAFFVYNAPGYEIVPT